MSPAEVQGELPQTVANANSRVPYDLKRAVRKTLPDPNRLSIGEMRQAARL